MQKPPPLFYIQAIGCKVSQVEAGIMRAQLEAAGWQWAQPGEPARMCIVHTCTVTGRAERDSRRALLRARRLHPQARLVASGCMADLEKETLAALPGVKAVVGRADWSAIAEIAGRILADHPAPSQQGEEPLWGGARLDRARAFVKIQDGCSGTCAYCRVRLARGPGISRLEDQVVAEVAERIQAGVQEIVLTGINIGSWQPGLAQLLERLANLPGRFRLRLSSLEPQHGTAELVALFGRWPGKLCPHVHLALQSGDDGVLQAMRRTYTAGDFLGLCRALAAARPGIALTADVIAGYPGETRVAFENTLLLAQSACLAGLHVFAFSARPGTEAAGLDGQLCGGEITSRSREMRRFSQTLEQQHRRNLAGRPAEILLEQRKGEHFWSGTLGTHDRAVVHCQGRRGMLVMGTLAAQDGNGPLMLKTESGPEVQP